MKNRNVNNVPPAVQVKSALSVPPALSRFGTRSKWRLYLFAAAITTAILVIRLALTPWLSERPALVLFLLPIIFSAYLGGLGPGLAATAIAAFGTHYLLLSPTRTFFIGNPVDLAQWLVLLLAGVLVSVLSEGLLQARRRAEASEKLHAVTLASIGDAVITTDNQGHLTYLNAEAERLTGWPLEQALGQPLLSVFRVLDEQTSQLVEILVEPVLRATTTMHVAEQWRLLTRDGRKIPIEANSAPIKLTDDSVLGVVLVFRDNTARKRAEEELRISEERFAAAFNASPEAMSITTFEEGRFVLVNDAWVEAFGVSREAALGQQFQQLNIWLDDAQRDYVFRQVRDTGSIVDYEITGQPIQGQTRQFLIDAKRILLGAESFVLSVSKDITARKRAEEELRQSERDFRALFNGAGVANAECDPRNGQFVRVNQKMCELTGYSAEELRSRTFSEITYAADVPSTMAAFRQFIAEKTSTLVLEKRYVRKDGTLIWINITASLLLDEAGQPWRTIAVIKDISERKHAEAELRASEQHFRALFDGAGVANVECEAQTGRFLRVNQRMCELTGYNAEELLTRSFSEITYPDDRAQNIVEYQRFISQQTPLYAVEKRYLRKDGTVAWVNVTSSLLLDPAGQPWRTVAAIQDITERKHIAAALQLSEERLRLLHQIISNPHFEHTEKINQLLALGCQQFGLENGLVGRLEQENYEVTYAVSQTNAFAPGWNCPAQQTFCYDTALQNDLLVFEHAGETAWREHQAYVTYGVETFFGVPLYCANQTYGTLCFSSLTPRVVPFTSGDQEFLRLMGQWISAELTRHATAESLRESEARFRALFEQTAVGSVIVDMETQHIVDCNQLAAEMLGYTRAEFLTLSVAELETLHSPAEIAWNKAALARNNKVQFETIYRKKTGELRDVMVVATNIQIQGRDFGYGSIVDITEKKQTERALQKERERLEKIASASPIVIYSFRLTPAGHYSYPYASPAFYDIYGLRPEDIINDARLTDERVHPDDFQPLVKSIVASARTMSHWRHIWRVNHPDKGEIWVEGYAAPIREENGDIIWHGMLNDVTERERIARALFLEKERLEKMAMASPLPMYSFQQTTDGKTSLPYASPALAEMFGLRPADLRQDGSAIFDHVHPDDLPHINESMAASAGNLSVLHVVYRYRHPHKGERWLENYAAPILEADGSITWHGIANDITERKQSEQELLLTQNQLRHLATHLQSVREEERTTIAREIHDDLGQMLTAMKFNLKWVAQALEPAATDAHQRVANTVELVGQTIQIVRRLATSLHPSILDDFGLPAALEWQITEFQKHSGIRCRIDALPQSVTLERNRALALFRICQETLTNVARHAAATEISLSLQEEQENIWLRIHDNGCGIAVDAVAKKRSLGLISMRERALSLGGEFSVQGAPGVGTTVTVRIPRPNALQPTLS